MMEQSFEAEKINLSSGDTHRHVTDSWWPLRTLIAAGEGCVYCWVNIDNYFMLTCVHVRKVCVWAKCHIRPALIPGFSTTKWPGVLLISLDGMLVLCKPTPSISHATSHLNTWLMRETLGEWIILPKNTKQWVWAKLKPRLLNLETSALTISKYTSLGWSYY